MTDESVIPAPAAGAIVPVSYDELGGMGFENTSEKDLSLPFLNVIQLTSNEVKESHSRFMKGAKPGMLVNTSTRELFDGAKGIVIVPLHITHCFTRWAARKSGGGFKGTLDIDAPEVKAAQAAFEKNPNPKKRLSEDVLLPDGTNIVETYYVFALQLSDDGETPIGGLVIPFTSTKISQYKKGIYTPCYTMKSATGKPMPLFANRLRLSTAAESRSDGDSYNYRIVPLKATVKESVIPADHPLARVALENYQSVASGKVKAAEQPREVDAAPGEGAPDTVFS